jgi:hypothetical protein
MCRSLPLRHVTAVCESHLDGCMALERAVATGCNTDSSLSAFGEVGHLQSDAAQGRSARSGRALEPSDRILGPSDLTLEPSELTLEPSEKSGTRNRTITRSMSQVYGTQHGQG